MESFAWVLSSKKPNTTCTPCALQVSGPADIGFFIKAGFQLHERCDRFASFGGFAERLHNRAIRGCPVERLLDRHDIGIAGGPALKTAPPHRSSHRVVDDKVFLANGGKAIATLIADALGKTGL